MARWSVLHLFTLWNVAHSRVCPAAQNPSGHAQSASEGSAGMWTATAVRKSWAAPSHCRHHPPHWLALTCYDVQTKTPINSCNVVKMEVSWNRGTPKSSILVGFSLINQPFGTTISGNPHIASSKLTLRPVAAGLNMPRPHYAWGEAKRHAPSLGGSGQGGKFDQKLSKAGEELVRGKYPRIMWNYHE